MAVLNFLIRLWFVRGSNLPPSLRRAALVAALVLTGLFAAGCGGSQTYVVKPGDTLPAIAGQYNVALNDLIKANQERYPSLAVNPERPTPGIELLIPSGGNAGLDEWVGRMAQAASAPITPAPDVPAASNEKIKAIVELMQQGINRARVASQLPALVWNAQLAEIAQARSNDMIRRAYFSHQDPQRGSVAFQDLIRAQSYKFLFAGENIAEIKNQGSLVPSGLTVYSRYGATELADQFVTGWVTSADHRENIMNPRFAKTGIGLGVSVDGTRVVATQLFSD